MSSPDTTTTGGTPATRPDGRPWALADLDGRVRDVLPGTDGPRLVVFVERDCPTSRGALAALAGGPAGRTTVVSQGRPQAALDLVRRCGAGALGVLVEPEPHPVSAAFDVRTVPTFVLVDAAGAELARLDGWDRAEVGDLLARAGGELMADGGLPGVKPGCQSRSTLDAPTQDQLAGDDVALGDGGDDDGIDEMWARGWHDGLPVVPPTRERVDAMLDGRDGDEVLGEVGPVMGELTLERLAVCAVLAGCEPAYLPVVRAAAEAILDDGFALHGMQNTTHFASPAVIVSGPYAAAIGMNGGSNVLGPGNRANQTIGRAVRLVMSLTGGGTPGGLDQSALGGPHKIGLCFPEREDASPWEPLRVTLGFDADATTVSVVGVESPMGVSDHYSSDAEGVAATLAAAMGNAWAPTWYPVGTHTPLVVCPEHARTFAEAGWSKADLRRSIFERCRRTAGDLRAAGTGELTPFAVHAETDDTEIPKFLSEDEIVIVVAGGDAGRFSAVLPPWVGFGLGSTMITREVHP
ncbi:MAG: thioredoxin [Actinobacteria bacterium]|nr:thioredoxin [Actinomycetota bacterium]